MGCTAVDDFIRYGFEKVFNVEKIVTVFYMEFSKDFKFDGEKHDFWEMVYIDKGEMICTADKREFVLKSGELTFHKPNEFHAIRSGGKSAPNLSIMTFECRSRAMKHFEGKIFSLTSEERALLSILFREALASYRMTDKNNPLIHKFEKIENAPFGGSQMTKNVLEIFLISLSRNTDVLAKRSRYQYKVNGVDIPYPVKEILDLLENNVYGRLNVEDIAKRLGKSVSTVKKLFSLYRAGGIMNYYNRLKIEEAKKLIREGEHNFSQISSMLQFDTPQYFSMTFKRFERMSPAEYKRSIL